MPRIVILGDSHVIAIAQALAHHFIVPPSGLTVEVLRLSHPVLGLAGDIDDAKMIPLAATLTAEDVIVTLFGGNHYNVLGLIQHTIPFDVMMPDDPAPTIPGAQIIPHRLMRDVFATRCETDVAPQLAALRAATTARMICLLPPPPKQDTAHILKGAGTFFRSRGVADLGVSPAGLRLKLWQMEQDALAAWCGAKAITVLPPPRDAVDSEGYLDRLYYHKDATHANTAYGALVLRDLLALAVTGHRSAATEGPV